MSSDSTDREEAQRSSVPSWDDLVLPEDTLRLLRAIAHRHEQQSRVYEEWGFARPPDRGPGITALLVGPPGTGKSFASEVIANALRLNLYRIDLSAVVSKYIGETEKNLRRVFEAAEDGGAILFFDEADALFGKREDKDSHDRYANIEVNYLLSQMEGYSGIAFIAAHEAAELDAAILRRLRFVVNFPFPNVIERQRIWEKVFPPATPLDVLDYESLASIEVTGGVIHDIALDAAIQAAHERTSITMDMICKAARTELRKWGLPLPEGCAESEDTRTASPGLSL
jgi:SpoVK/Ycf46/Vps4 family AAA+-type ATPase